MNEQEKIEENLHPFIVDEINETLCFAHNGTIQEHVFKDSEKSDTFILNKTILDN